MISALSNFYRLSKYSLVSSQAFLAGHHIFLQKIHLLKVIAKALQNATWQMLYSSLVSLFVIPAI